MTADLKKRGHQVWIDLTNIKKGGLWEVHVEQGIRAASYVLAVMTRSSLRANSICRDEVAYAIKEDKRVIPVRVSVVARL